MLNPKDDEELDAFLAEINRTTLFYPMPDDPFFDPVGASDEALKKFGIPPRPDAAEHPQHYALWRSMFSQPEDRPPLQFVKTAFSFVSNIGIPSYRFVHGSAPRVVGSRRQGSANWSGACLTANGGRAFTEVHGLWQVPHADAPAEQEPGDYRSSTWIGLDGQRRYLHSSLPQIGTAQFAELDQTDTTTRKTTAWFQWWLRDHHNPAVDLSLVVSPSDVVRCALYVIDPAQSGNPKRVSFHIKNESTGHILTPFERPAPMASGGRQVRITGSTAEWVTERPTKYFSDEIYPLPNYGTVLFSACKAVATGPTGTVVRDLTGARLIDMRERRAGPATRTRKVSQAKLLRDANGAPTQVMTRYR